MKPALFAMVLMTMSLFSGIWKSDYFLFLNSKIAAKSSEAENVGVEKSERHHKCRSPLVRETVAHRNKNKFQLSSAKLSKKEVGR